MLLCHRLCPQVPNPLSVNDCYAFLQKPPHDPAPYTHTLLLTGVWGLCSHMHRHTGSVRTHTRITQTHTHASHKHRHTHTKQTYSGLCPCWGWWVVGDMGVSSPVLHHSVCETGSGRGSSQSSVGLYSAEVVRNTVMSMCVCVSKMGRHPGVLEKSTGLAFHWGFSDIYFCQKLQKKNI